MQGIGLIDLSTGKPFGTQNNPGFIQLTGSNVPLVPWSLEVLNILGTSVGSTSVQFTNITDSNVALLRTKSLFVNNTTNQPVVINPVPYDRGLVASPTGENASTFSVAAGTTGWIGGSYPITNTAGNVLGNFADHCTAIFLGYTFATLPTSGSLQITLIGKK